MELMNLSYEMRRNDILCQVKPLHQILNDYPFLGDYQEVCIFLVQVVRIMVTDS